MSTYQELAPILEILLQAIAQECNTTQDQLSLEVEQVALKALIAAHQKGCEFAHERPTARRPSDPNFRRPKGTFETED